MQTSRRSFVHGLAAAGVALPAFPAFREDAFARLFRANTLAGSRPPEAVAEDELYWTEIQRAFDADRTMQACIAADRSASRGGRRIRLPLVRSE